MNKVYKFCFNLCVMLSCLLMGSVALAIPLTGIKTIPGTYASVTLAVADLNASGVGAGGVVFNIAAAYTETVTATLSVTATGTAGNPIIFRKDPSTPGAKPLITAYTGGSATPASATQDGIWRFVGTDYLTIDSIDLAGEFSEQWNCADGIWVCILQNQSF